MKSRLRSSHAMIALVGLSTIHSPPSTLAQGSLTPPGPPGPTMRSLDQIEPRTPIRAAPFVITNAGSYCLTTNLVGTSGTNAIIIACGDVTLDLNGFAVVGAPGTLDGISISGSQTNIAIRNGTVRGWGGGAVTAFGNAGRNFQAERLRVSQNGASGILWNGGGADIRDCQAVSNRATGIQINGGVLSHCTSDYNAGDGISASSALISECTASYNVFDGIAVNDSMIRNCMAMNNDAGGAPNHAGINIGGSCLINGCLSEFNGSGTNGFGIYVSTGPYHVIENCIVVANGNDGIRASQTTIVGNTVNENGISAVAAGIRTIGSGSRIEGNQVVGNNGFGIRSEGGVGADVVIRNTASQNLTGAVTNNYSPASGTSFAPIQNPSNATNAWGNTSY